MLIVEKLHQCSKWSCAIALPKLVGKLHTEGTTNASKHACTIAAEAITQKTPKKGINRKNFARTPPPLQEGTPDPANSLCLGSLFPSKYRKKAYIKNFEGEVFGARIFFMLNFFVCFFCT